MAHVDFMVLSEHDEPVLFVEVKAQPGTSPDWATRFRKNLIDHGVMRRRANFLLVAPERLYLWTEKAQSGDAPPEYTASAPEALRDITKRTPKFFFSEEEYESIVKTWLQHLTHAVFARDEVQRHHPWLVDSGLFDRIRNGQVVEQAAR